MERGIALVTAQSARERDEDIAPLTAALTARGERVSLVNWDDSAVNWSAFDLALLRSPWDYTARLPEFLSWAKRASAETRLVNDLAVIQWNTDKHYLAELGAAGVATIPTRFAEPGDSAAHSIAGFLATVAGDAAEFVVKPAVGAGSQDAQRFMRSETALAVQHLQRLLAAGKSALLQPYLSHVDEHGEAALIYFAGRFSHSIRKNPMLVREGSASSRGGLASERITPRRAEADELRLAAQLLAALPFDVPLYARVDLLRDAAGRPTLLELELTEPSLFLESSVGAADRFAAAISALRASGTIHSGTAMA